MSAGSVTFEPGARSNWHTHPVGQVLIVTAGLGWVQQAGGETQEMRPGDVVLIPPDVRHWHGASPTTSVTHIALQEQADGSAVNWLDPSPTHNIVADQGCPSTSGTSAKDMIQESRRFVHIWRAGRPSSPRCLKAPSRNV